MTYVASVHHTCSTQLTYQSVPTSQDVLVTPRQQQCDKGSRRIGCWVNPMGRIPSTFTPITGDIDDRQQENIATLQNNFILKKRTSQTKMSSESLRHNQTELNTIF